MQSVLLLFTVIIFGVAGPLSSCHAVGTVFRQSILGTRLKVHRMGDLGFATGFTSKKFSQQGCPREAVWCLRKMLAAHKAHVGAFFEKL